MSYLIRQMGHIAFEVPDPLASATDLRDTVGVKITKKASGSVSLSSNARDYEVTYLKGETPRVMAIGFEAVSPEAIDEIAARVKSDGLEVIDDRPLLPGIAKAVRFRAPCGAIFEVHTPVARSQGIFHVGNGSRPRRFEHVNVLCKDIAAMSEFITKTLGMKASDYAGDGLLSWYRAADGYHHTIALGPGPDKLHHYAFDLRSLEDLAGIADTLSLNDRALIWGPGRHGAGGNVFTYYIDTDGCVVENSIEMARIDADELYEPNHWQIGEGMSGRWINLWGGGPPPNFGDAGMAFA